MVCTHLQNEQERWPSIVHNWSQHENDLLDAESNGGWTLDNIEKDLKRASLSLYARYGITTGRNRVRLEELVKDRTSLQHPWPNGPTAYRMIT